MKKGNLQVKKSGGFSAWLKKDLIAWFLILPFLTCIFFILWKPTFTGVLWSFFEMNGYNLGEFCGFDNYRVIVQDTQFLGVLGNTFKYVGWSIVIGFFVPIIYAIIISELRFGKSYFRFAAYFPVLIPGIANSMLWYYIYYPNASGLLNQFFGVFGIGASQWLQNGNLTIPLILVSSTWHSFGSTMLLYFASLQGINKELYEAALIDGAGILTRIRKIALPHMGSIILLNFVRQIISVFQILEEPLAMTGGGPRNASTSLGLLGYRYAFQNFKVGNALALNAITFMILITITIFYFWVSNRVEQDA